MSVNLHNLTISYDRHPAVHHLSGAFSQGSLTAITGPNGAGKSTLLKAIAGIVTPIEGHIDLPQDCRIGYLPQAADIDRNFPFSVLQMIMIGLWHQSGASGRWNAADKNKALRALDTVGLHGFEQRPLTSLSAGQFQRALFARLLMQEADILLLDEPFTAIDADTTAKLLALMHRWHKEKRTIICVLHDHEQIRQHFPECLLLARRPIAWGRTHETLHPENLLQSRTLREPWDKEAKACV